MKQGNASHSGSGATKPTTVVHNVNVEAISEIGMQVVRHNSAPLYEGRGLEAPMKSCESHPCGSQGKHK